MFLYLKGYLSLLLVSCSHILFSEFPPYPSYIGSSYSTNIHEVNVTIAGSVCDVQSTNITHIICVTNAQRQSQQTKVRVSIGDQGIAKMVRQQPTRAKFVFGHTNSKM